MADSGKLASVTFAGTTYDTDDCIQVANFNKGTEDLTYRCGGYFKHVPGDRTISLQFSLALSKTDTTKIAALVDGAVGTAEYHPFGDTATYIEHTTTKATISVANESGGPGNIVMLDVTMFWDDLTSGAAI